MFTQRPQGPDNQAVSTRSGRMPDQFAASFLPCLLSAVPDGSDAANELPPALLLRCLLLASTAFLAEFRMASVLKDAGLQSKKHDRNRNVMEKIMLQHW